MRSVNYPIYILFSCLVIVPLTFPLIAPQDPACQNPLGMENGKIKDKQLFSPENDFTSAMEAYKARLNGKHAYCIAHSDEHDEGFYQNLYIIVDFGGVDYEVTGISLQGYNQYSYGSEMQLWYYTNQFVKYEHNHTTLITLHDKKGNDVEYLPMKPIFTSKLKIQLPHTKIKHCLRMEIYGCKRSTYKQYFDCGPVRESLLEKNYSEMKFSQTDAVKQDVAFSAKYLIFSKPYAWCLMKSSVHVAAYKDWATIDMIRQYLIYGIEVKGYRQRSDDTEDNMFIAKLFKFQYSLNGKEKSDFERRKELSTNQLMTSFNVPLIARYIYISIKLDENGKLTCIKLELYGCEATVAESTITVTPVNQISTTEPTSAVAHINRYKIFEGSKYSPGINWIDSKYNGREIANGELKDGTGCLTDGQSTPNDNPFSSPNCWIGWKENKTRQPFIYIELLQPTLATGIRLLSYVNDSMGASPIRRITISAGINERLTSLGCLCSPDSFYNRQPAMTEYYIVFDNIVIQYLQLQFQYSGQWILIRHVDVILKGETVESSLKLTKGMLECNVPNKQSVIDANAWKIPLIIFMIVAVSVLLSAFTIYQYSSTNHQADNNGGNQTSIEVVQEDQRLTIRSNNMVYSIIHKGNNTDTHML